MKPSKPPKNAASSNQTSTPTPASNRQSSRPLLPGKDKSQSSSSLNNRAGSISSLAGTAKTSKPALKRSDLEQTLKSLEREVLGSKAQVPVVTQQSAVVLEKKQSAVLAPGPVKKDVQHVTNQLEKEDEYEDDFEAYEDEDFEDYSESSDEAPISTLIGPSSKDKAETLPDINHRMPILPFAKSSVAVDDKDAQVVRREMGDRKLAPGRNSVMALHLKRAKELQNFVVLEKSIDLLLFHMPPVSAYEEYIRSFGRGESTQVAIQCGDDNQMDVESQCRPVDQMTRWVQTYGCEGREGCGVVSAKQSDKKRLNKDMQSLTSFLSQAGKVMEQVLERNISDGFGIGAFEIEDSTGFSQSHTRLDTDSELLKGRSVKTIQFSPHDQRLLLIAWSLPADDTPAASFTSYNLHRKGILTSWLVNESGSPSRVFVVEGEPTYLSFVEDAPHLLIAGTTDGGVSVWDARDKSSCLNTITFESKGLHRISPIQHPTFITDAIDFRLKANEKTSFPDGIGHMAPICYIQALSSTSEQVSSAQSELAQDFKTVDIKIMTGDVNGKIVLWHCIDLSTDSTFISDDDSLLTAIGSSLKLLPIETFETSKLVNDIALLRDKQKHALVFGTLVDGICKFSRSGVKQFPYQYYFMNGIGNPNVHCLSVHPYIPDLFLAGYGDGNIVLFKKQFSEAVRGWTLVQNNERRLPKQIVWARRRPSVFYVLDTQGGLWIYDLLDNGLEPCHIVSFYEGKGATKGCSISLSARPRELETNSNALLAVAIMDPYLNALIEIHTLEQKLSEAQVDEWDFFKTAL